MMSIPEHDVEKPRRRLPTILVGLLLVCAAAAAVAVWWPRAGGRTDAAKPAWDVLLITLDTTRADRIGCYGYGRAVTPTLDRLSREGVRYERCYSPAPLTMPSHASLLTGLTPARHRVHANGSSALSEAATTLAEVFKSEGYATGAAVGSFVLDRRFGLGQGFDLYDDDMRVHGTGSQFRFASRAGNHVTDTALAWWKEHSEGRKFFWAHYYDVHAPCNPAGYDRARSGLTPYDAEIEFVDGEVNRLLEHLKETGRASHTLVIVVADHGEALYDHGEPTHGLFTYEEVMRVPLLVRFPNGRDAGRTVQAPVALVDVFPSILSWLEIESPGELDGLVLPTKAAGGDTRNPSERPIYFENHATAESYGWSRLVGLVLGDEKLIRAPRSERYQLDADPLEEHNLYAPDDARSVELDARLDTMLEDLIALPSLDLDEVVMEDEDAARLRALGYLGGGTESDDADERANETRIGADPKDVLPAYLDILASISLIEALRVEQAADLLLEVVTSKDPRSYRATYLLAEIVLEPAVQDKCLSYLEGVDLSEHSSILNEYVCHRLGLALVARGEPDRALPYLRQALAIDSEDTNVRQLLAMALRQTGAPAGEVDAVLGAAMGESSATGHLIEVGDAYERAGRFEAAIELYADHLKQHPNDAAFLNNLAWLLVTRTTQFERALSLADRAVAVDAEVAEFHDTRGHVLYRLKRHEEAIVSLRRAVELRQQYGTAHFHLAMALKAVKRHDEEKLALERALSSIARGRTAWSEEARSRLVELAGE